MKISTLLFGILAGSAAAAPAAHLETRAGTCTNPIQRKEWRKMNVLEKTNFLLAVKCLMVLPSKLKSTYPAAVSRYDDFIVVHQAETPKIHFNGAFLPWHREYLHQFEDALRSECFYFGGLPYWESALDADNLTASPVMSGKLLSFGGDGVGPLGPGDVQLGSGQGNCIADGIFKNSVVHIKQGPAPAVREDHCIQRFVTQGIASVWLQQSMFDAALAQPNYENFAVVLEGTVIPENPLPTLGTHNAGHISLGGEMGNMFTSPSDPLFWLHHANIDRIWTKWQAQDPAARQYAVGNPIAPRIPLLSAFWPNPPEGDVTLDFELVPLGVTAGQVLNVQGKGLSPSSGKAAGVLCYNYA